MLSDPRIQHEYFIDLVRRTPPMPWEIQKRLMAELGFTQLFIDHVERLRWELVDGLKGITQDRVN